mmetsp:Transcript_39211/g.65060  ORF Transcript_39211/g.65060 Transcript_39211/m.65060 type:complete len:219 (+) Transcript_39211:54-710(+)
MLALIPPAALALNWIAAATTNSTIYIIRHGEKTWGGGCLNIQGQERMNNMPNVFNGKDFHAPKAIFANKYNGQPECERCWLTVQTIAQHLKVPVTFDYGYPKELGGNQAAADAIKKSALANKVVLVSWEHYNIQFLTADLGVAKHNIPYWSRSDYDTVYALTLEESGAVKDFVVKAQNYVPKSTTCDPAKYVPPPGEPGESYEDDVARQQAAREVGGQ